MQESCKWSELRRELLRHQLHPIAEVHLKREFYNAPQVKAVTAQVEQQVLTGKLSTFSGAVKLLQAFRVQ